LRRSGHVVFVRQFQLGAKPKAGYRIIVDGQKMTVWGLWARFDRNSGMGNPHMSLSLTPRSERGIGAADPREGWPGHKHVVA
jgi:hypothetical protein